MNLFGFNTIRTDAEDEARIVAMRPSVIRETGDWSRALRFKAMLPDSIIVFRAYVTDRDDYDWKQFSPEAYDRENVSRYAEGGIYLQVGNEDMGPDLDLYIAWNLELLRMQRGRTTRLALLPFPVGNPPRYDTDYNKLLPIFEEMARPDNNRHLFIPNEYWPHDASLSEIAAGHYIGRFQRAWEACDRVGIPRPKTVIGECGPVVRRDDNSLDAYRGWGAVTHVAEFALEQMRAVANFYQKLSVPVALFAWKPYAPFEQYYDISKYSWAVEFVENGGFMVNPNTQTQNNSIEIEYQRGRTTVRLSLRVSPTTAADRVTTMPQDVLIDYAPGQPIQADGYEWVRVRYNEMSGWSALQQLGGPVWIKPVADSADNELDGSETQQIIELHRTMMETHAKLEGLYSDMQETSAMIQTLHRELADLNYQYINLFQQGVDDGGE